MHQLALAKNIHLFCLPAHTTHHLQPLDVGVFGPLAQEYLKQCDEILTETGDEIPIQDFIKEYMHAHSTAFKPKTIKNAFRRSSICLLNPDIFTEADYGPSAPASIMAHLPASYPT